MPCPDTISQCPEVSGVFGVWRARKRLCFQWVLTSRTLRPRTLQGRGASCPPVALSGAVGHGPRLTRPGTAGSVGDTARSVAVAGACSEIEVADVGGAWRLFCRIGAGRKGWVEFVLRALDRKGNLRERISRRCPKRAYWLGHNGIRLARSRDAGLLYDHHPDIHAAVCLLAARHVAMLVLAD